MPIQPELNFGQPLHTHENNKESQSTYEDNWERLNNNAKILYRALLRGERLSGRDIVSKYGMMEYRRRIKDLRDAGLPITDEKLKGGSKIWFIEK